MSYFGFMACSRELECGDYIRPPKAIYPSYVDYMNSEDYQINLCLPDRRYCAPTDPTKAIGSVHVYEKHYREIFTRLRPFPNPNEWTEEIRSFIADQFTLPYLYSDAFGSKEVCQFLQPGDQVEILDIFLGHDEPLVKPVSCTIDLQPFAEGKMTLNEVYAPIAKPPANNLIRYIPPRTPCGEQRYIIHDISDRICTVFCDLHEEHWNPRMLRDQHLL